MTESVFPASVSDRLIDRLVKLSVVGQEAWCVNIVAVRKLPLRIYAHSAGGPESSGGREAAEAVTDSLMEQAIIDGQVAP